MDTKSDRTLGLEWFGRSQPEQFGWICRKRQPTEFLGYSSNTAEAIAALVVDNAEVESLGKGGTAACWSIKRHSTQSQVARLVMLGFGGMGLGKDHRYKTPSGIFVHQIDIDQVRW